MTPTDLMREALDEIACLVVDPPDCVVAIDLITQVLKRVDDAIVDDALERLAQSGALDPDPPRRKAIR